MNVLFISYVFEPDPSVGAKRMSYWAQNFKSHLPNSRVYLITTTKNPSSKGIDKVISTTPNNSSLLSYVIKDKGVGWKPSIISALKKNKITDLSHVIISGGPFMQFSIIDFLKKEYSAKVVLDYRDPFAINPRFQNNVLKVSIKRFFERRFNKAADLIISVNDYCLELLTGFEKNKKKFKVIPNGFNEQLLPNVINQENTNEKLTIIYAGTFYEDRSPVYFLKALQRESGVELAHIGKPSEYLAESRNVKEFGMRPYDEMLELINKSDVGLIITSGEPFESTTKIYDYIALKKPILVITSGELYSGAIGQDLENYPVVWCKNNEESIKNAFIELRKLQNITVDSHKYSRKKGLESLIQQLKNLEQ
ncbi:MAG: hypothetical protein RJQ00_10705 [Vicingaceae bacterium]